MAQFLALIPMTAGNFDSESATNGHVLTADGSGGATWEEGGGGGGASFAFDGVTFTPGTYTAGSTERNITITLTSGGVEVGEGYYFVYIWAGYWYEEWYPYNSLSTVTGQQWRSLYPQTDGFSLQGWYLRDDAGQDLAITLINTAEEKLTATIMVMLPDGKMAVDATVEIPGSVE